MIMNFSIPNKGKSAPQKNSYLTDYGRGADWPYRRAFEMPDRKKIPETDIIMETRKGVALSYAPEQVAVWTLPEIKKQSVHYRILRSYKDTLHGRSGGTWTPGLLVPNQARYQLRYTPSA